MSSYFDYFCQNIVREDGISDRIAGTCYSMCPEEEVKLREKEHLVHVLEVWGSERKLVKNYSRSAADSNMAIPHLLRPTSVLRNTVQYLLLDITGRVDVPTSVVYDFVNDRLRAVRQDMTIQRLPPEDCVSLLEPMIRFYVYYSHELSNVPLKDYDPVLNKKYLLECLKWYLYCCDTITKTQGKVDQLSGFLSTMDLGTNIKQNKLVNDHILMESLYILCNLDDLHPLFRYVRLPKDVKRQTKLQLAYKIAIANLQGNYIKVCCLLDKLCPLTYCALYTFLPTLQRRALQVMSHAYYSKRLTVPSATLVAWLRFPHESDAQAACAHYGLAVEGDAVRFDKSEFKTEATLVSCLQLHERALQVMSHAYYSKRLTVPSATLVAWLRFPHESDAQAACAHYGLAVEGDAVRFDKSEFKTEATLSKLKPQDIKKKFNISIIDIFTYT